MRNPFKYNLILCFFVFFSCKQEKQFFEHKSFQFGLYKDQIPCDSKKIKQEVTDNFRGKLIEEVRNPELKVFLPDRFEDNKIPFFLIVPGNDGKTIAYGSEGESLFDEMKKLDIGVALWTYRLPNMAAPNCEVDVMNGDLIALEEQLKSYIPNWQVNMNEIGVIAYGKSSKFIFEGLNVQGQNSIFRHQIYLEPNIADFDSELKYGFEKDENVLLMTNTTKSPMNQEILVWHERLLDSNCNSTLLELRNSKVWNVASFRPFDENIFSWIIRKVDFDDWGRAY